MQKNTKKILLTGGGTGGSVAPLLAIADSLRVASCELRDFLWIGTKQGLEREMVENAGIKFKPIFSGKFRRYLSLRNFIDPFLITFGFFQAFFIMLKWKPNLVVSAGSFVSVPVVWAAWLLRTPVLIHQQDARPGLANKLMAPFAKIITVTFEKSLADYGRKAVWAGNPVRSQLSITNYQLRINDIKKKFQFKDNLPIILVIGGGTGAVAINELVEKNLKELTKLCNIIHLTGKNKSCELRVAGYENYDFLNSEQMAQAYAAADIIVSRCGMGVLTELSYLGKPSILIPMPDSHQEDNAEIFNEKQAAIVLDQKELNSEKLVESIKQLLNNQKLRDKLSDNIKTVVKRGASEKIVDIVERVTQHYN